MITITVQPEAWWPNLLVAVGIVLVIGIFFAWGGVYGPKGQFIKYFSIGVGSALLGTALIFSSLYFFNVEQGAWEARAAAELEKHGYTDIEFLEQGRYDDTVSLLADYEGETVRAELAPLSIAPDTFAVVVTRGAE